MHFGQKIKALAEQKKLSASELSSILGKKSRRSAYDIYNNEDINTKDLRTIAAHFGVPISYFFQDTSGNDSGHNLPEKKVITEDVGDNAVIALLKEQLAQERQDNKKLERENTLLKTRKMVYRTVAEDGGHE